MKGYRTVGYIATTLIAVISVPEVQNLIAEYPVTATIINGVVIGILRVISTTPIFNKEK